MFLYNFFIKLFNGVFVFFVGVFFLVSGAKAQLGQEVVSTLLDDGGLPLLPVPAAIPNADVRAIFNGLYATKKQADWLMEAVPDSALWLEVNCCSLDGIFERAGEAAKLTGSDWFILVEGDDLDFAAYVSNLLVEKGHEKVWLITAP